MRDYEGFQGTIGRTHADSVPHWPGRPVAPNGAPNVLVILIDDLGFSHFGCYGSTLSTPNIDALAAGGLRYTNFHVTPLCSPTRAALLTGRQAHEVGMRGISNWNTGFPNMRGQISPHAATVAEVLRDRGYTTFALGKWHLAQMVDCSAAGRKWRATLYRWATSSLSAPSPMTTAPSPAGRCARCPRCRAPSWRWT